MRSEHFTQSNCGVVQKSSIRKLPNKYFTNLAFPVRTVRYRSTIFPPSIYGSRLGHKSKKKIQSITKAKRKQQIRNKKTKAKLKIKQKRKAKKTKTETKSKTKR